MVLSAVNVSEYAMQSMLLNNDCMVRVLYMASEHSSEKIIRWYTTQCSHDELTLDLLYDDSRSHLNYAQLLQTKQWRPLAK